MRVKVTLPSGEVQDVDLTSDAYSIGRSRSNDLVVPDAQLSRHHAQLVRLDDGAWAVEDLGSLNGTRLNGARVEGRVPIDDGDLVELGASSIQIGDAQQPTPRLDLTVLGQSRISEGSLRSMGGAGRERGALSDILHRAARAMTSGAEPTAVLREMLDLALEGTRAERGLVARSSGRQQLEPLVSVPPFDSADPPLISRSVQERVLEHGESVILEDVSTDAQIGSADTVVVAGVRSILCAPLGTAEAPCGVFYLDSLAHRARFDEKHLEIATILAGMAGIVLESEAARRALLEKQRLDAELEAAWTIQSRLLPGEAPEACDGYGVAGHHTPCQAVGGDLYDFFELEGGRQGIMVCDIAGKGLTAALLGSGLHARWRALTQSSIPPQEWLSRLNVEIREAMPDNRFLTIAFGVADPRAGTLTYASAGQPSFLLQDGEVRDLGATGPILGMFPDIDYEAETIAFRDRDGLVLFTDGVTDQLSPSSEPFTEERLKAAVDPSPDVDPASILERVLDALRSHTADAPQDDDTTVAVLQRQG